MKVANIIGYLLFGFLCVFVYKTFTDPIVVHVATPASQQKVAIVTSDEQCVTWLFQSNLMQARERMCGRKAK